MLLLAPKMSFYQFIGLTMIYSGFVFAIYPLSIAHVNDFLEAEQLVPASAGLYTYDGLRCGFWPNNNFVCNGTFRRARSINHVRLYLYANRRIYWFQNFGQESIT